MSNGKTICIAVAAVLAATLLIPIGGAAAAGASSAKCPNYAQLTGGGKAYNFTEVTASNVSCKTALIVLEIFPNVKPGHSIEGFNCARRRAGKKLTANCVNKAETVAFTYKT